LLNVFGGFGVDISYRISIGSLIIITLLGLFFLLRVPEVRPDSTVEEFGPGDEVLDSSPSPEEDTKL